MSLDRLFYKPIHNVKFCVYEQNVNVNTNKIASSNISAPFTGR